MLQKVVITGKVSKTTGILLNGGDFFVKWIISIAEVTSVIGGILTMNPLHDMVCWLREKLHSDANYCFYSVYVYSDFQNV